MRRKDREVTDIKELTQIIDECKVCRIGMADEEGIYIVPLNFGYEFQKDRLVLYFHGAKEGRKVNAVRKSPGVCVEMDCEHRLIAEDTACRCGYSFKSIIGNGTACIVDDMEEKKKGLTLLMKHQMDRNDVFTDTMADSVLVFKVVLDTFTGKYHR